MGTSSKIEWTDTTWNPVVGCSHVSAGCDGCYAARDAAGRLKNSPIYAGLATKPTPDALPRFTGEIRLLPDRLDQPLRWREPRRVFVNSMSDLFHRDVERPFIEDVFATMAATPRHSFQVLTKRPERARALIGRTTAFEAWVRDKAALIPGAPTDFVWPLPNVWLGTSVEDQRYANIRIPQLLATPAAVRFLSIEPLLGPVDIEPWLDGCGPECDHADESERVPGIGWVIVGGESGPRARPMHPQWARDLRDQCVDAGIPFLFKQWGEYVPMRIGTPGAHTIQLDDNWYAARVGKKAAGRELDGREWNEYPTSVGS